ncbi:MAG TPA: hypothetical protein LFW20_06055 [Rickettsia endosymbiont of Omalisus fontisbellaquei]|nr:hypothetical protein [Rickettsia endosymbiont of Omalisus fontisbellaquei]
MKEQKKLCEHRVDENLVEPIINQLKRKYKDKLSELELLEVARKFIKINRILITIIKNSKGIDATGLWFVYC